MADHFRSSTSLTAREVKRLNAAIKELDLEGQIDDLTFLPDELIEPGLWNRNTTVPGDCNQQLSGD